MHFYAIFGYRDATSGYYLVNEYIFPLFAIFIVKEIHRFCYFLSKISQFFCFLNIFMTSGGGGLPSESSTVFISQLS